MQRIFKIAFTFLISCSLFLYSFPTQAEAATKVPVPAKAATKVPAPAKSVAAITNESNFPSLLTAKIPSDIPISPQVEKQLLQSNFPLLQRIFDLFSWQSFIAVNWPVDAQNNPLPKVTDSGVPRWLTWHESLSVFRPDGGDPANDPPRKCDNNPDGQLREIYATSSVFSNTVDKDIADEVNQAFTSPLYDQNGNEVRYEIFLNDSEYNYIVQNHLYNLDGQIAYSQANHQPVNFPSGNNATGEQGVIELKLAWKELDPQRDIPSRFYTQTVLLPELDESGEPILDDDGNFKNCQKQQVGLVGMHISHKTKSSPQWVWATFEHVDNLNVNDLKKVDGKPLYALFHDYSPAGQTLPVNVPPIPRDPNTGKPDAQGIRKTQVSRPIPIPKAKQALNQAMQILLAVSGSPLQYYQLIDTQWPTAPYPSNTGYTAVPGGPSPSNLPEAITRKATGSPAPVYLTNSIMETYLQNGNQEAHFQENGFPFNNAPVFGTESCVACHFSAGIATSYVEKAENSGTIQKVPIFAGDLTADFSWLLQLKANWAK
jgi:hypothetical protein